MVEIIGHLTLRWTPLMSHTLQQAAWDSPARYIVIPAGRRAGKTEIAKRFLVTKAMTFDEAADGRFIACAPTQAQAKKIYWRDLKAMVPEWALESTRERSISETELTIRLYNGARIEVCGMDKPERVEGEPIDGIILDEYGNMKPDAWTHHIRPGLTTLGRPPGWAWLIGVPEGRNHYYKTYRGALADKTGRWAAFTWPSSDILPQEEIEAAREDLDPLTFQQEYEASFVNFAGRAYYNWEPGVNDADRVSEWYDDEKPLTVCFDFNVEPGVCAITQELPYQGTQGQCAMTLTCAIAEVYIERNSNTPLVMSTLTQRFKNHKGEVIAYGDATGGARGTSQTTGSDWDIIKQAGEECWGDQFRVDVPRANPSERSRLNAFNSRICSASGTVRFLACPVGCPKLCEDLEGVRTREDGSLDKKKTPLLTHISDAVGYQIARRWPIELANGSRVGVIQL